jgi:hypothetical protein
MSTLVKVARYHLVRPWAMTMMPWANLTFAFLVALVIYAEVPVKHHEVLTSGGLVSVANASGRDTGALATIFVSFFVIGIVSVGKSLPFGLTLGMSRRSYYTGTALFGTVLALADATGLTVLRAIEQATGGWGVKMSFFRVPYLLSGPWYETWLTSFVGLAFLFMYGMWFGTVQRRWGMIGTLAFIAAQITVATAGVLAVTWTSAWPAVGDFFLSVTALGLTGLAAALGAALLAGGRATIRRATV